MGKQSQNGYPASEDRAAIQIRTFYVPGTQVKLALRADIAPLILAMGQWWNENVEPLVIGHNWGYAYRDIRGRSQLSNHASGTAADYNAPAHPLGVAGTLGSKERAVIAKAASLGLRSGAGYSGRKDDMHVEVNVPLPKALELVRALQGAPRPVPTGPVPSGGRPLLELRNPFMTDGTGPNGAGPIHDFQRVGSSWYRNAAIDVDGVYGNDSVRLAKYVQRMNGLLEDGKVGDQTYRALRML